MEVLCAGNAASLEAAVPALVDDDADNNDFHGLDADSDGEYGDDDD